MKKIAVLAVALMLLALAGCKLSPFSTSPDNIITTTIEHPDGTKEIREEKMSDDTAFVKGQVEAVEKQKPLFEMVAQEGEEITISGMKSMRVYAPRNSEIKQYISAAERIFINGMPLLAMVAQGFFNSEAMVKIVNAVGALKADASSNTYNITTQDGSPVAITKNGNIANGTVTVTKPSTVDNSVQGQ